MLSLTFNNDQKLFMYAYTILIIALKHAFLQFENIQIEDLQQRTNWFIINRIVYTQQKGEMEKQ